MAPVRVATAALPRILCDIIDAVLAGEADVEVVARGGSVQDLRGLVGRHRVDVAIIGLDRDALSDVGRELFAEDPFVRVLGVVDQGKHTFLYELRPHCVPLSALSPEALVSVVRQTARRGEHAWAET